MNNKDKNNAGVSQKSRLALSLYSGLFGYLGVQDFYAGKIKKGIARIVLFVVSFLLYLGGMIVVSVYPSTKLSDLNLIPIVAGLIGLFIEIIWLLVTFILSLCGKYTDKHGDYIKNWKKFD
ncbi:MAG: hypothetical protein MJ188_11210 [Treponema sp.]|nr:hypothetical protein [Treponema sp.]